MSSRQVPTAGAPSIDRRAQDTTYHLYSATDGFVPTVSRRGPAQGIAGAAGARAASPTSSVRQAPARVATPPQPATGAAGAPTTNISERGARAVQAATFALRDKPGAFLEAELKVAKARSPEAYRAPPKRERGRLASGGDRSARRARSRQERRAVGVQAQTQASTTKQKYTDATEATATPEVARRWRDGVDTRLNRVETAAEYLQDEMEDLREENLDLVDQVNLSLGEADDKCVAMDQLRARMEADLEKQKQWMEAQLSAVKSTELSLDQANARVAGNDTMLLRQMDMILAALGDTTARVMAVEEREKGQLAHIAELQAQLQNGGAAPAQALTQEGAAKAEQKTAQRLAKLEAQVESLMLDEQQVDDRKGARPSRGGQQRESQTSGKLAHRIVSVEKQLSKLDSRLDEHTKTSDENDLKLQRQIEKAARTSADERREIDRLLHTLGENAASTQIGLEEVSVSASSTRAALKELDEWIRAELEESTVALERSHGELSARLKQHGGRVEAAATAGSDVGSKADAMDSASFDSWATEQEGRFAELDSRLSSAVAHSSAESLHIGSKVSDLQELCEELSATIEELSAQCTEALAHAESGTVGARRSELAALASRVDKLADSVATGSGRANQSADDIAVVELAKAMGEQMQLTHAMQDQMQASAADIGKLAARVDSIAASSPAGGSSRGKKAATSGVDHKALSALESKQKKSLEAMQTKLSGSIAQASADMDYRVTEVHSKCEELDAQKKIVQDRFAALEELQNELAATVEAASATAAASSRGISSLQSDELTAMMTRLDAFEGTIAAGSDFSRASSAALDELSTRVEQLGGELAVAQEALGSIDGGDDAEVREELSALQDQLLELKVEQASETATLREEVAKMPALHESLGATLTEMDTNAAAIEDKIERTETSLRVALSTLQKEVQSKHEQLETSIAATVAAATAAAAASSGEEHEGVNSAEFAALSATQAAQTAQFEEFKASLGACVTEESLSAAVAEVNGACTQACGGLSEEVAAVAERAASAEVKCDDLSTRCTGLLEEVSGLVEQSASTAKTCDELATHTAVLQEVSEKVDALGVEISSVSEASSSAMSAADAAMSAATTAGSAAVAAAQAQPSEDGGPASMELQGEVAALSSRLEGLEASTTEEKDAVRTCVTDLAQQMSDTTGSQEAIENRLEELSSNTEAALATIQEEVEKRANKQHLAAFGELIGNVDRKVAELDARLEQDNQDKPAEDDGAAAAAAIKPVLEELEAIKQELAACSATCTDLGGLTTQVTGCAASCEATDARVQEMQVAVSGCVTAAEGMNDLSEKVAGIKSDLSDMVETSYEDMEELRVEMVCTIRLTYLALHCLA
jgi:chromosome segregation ATPase